MKPFALTIGEPAGIGPDIVLQLWAQQPDLFSPEKITLIGNKKLLRARADLLGIENIQALSVVDIPLPAPCKPGQLQKDNARFVVDMLTVAAERCMQKQYAGIVTAPIHKGILNDAGFALKGHTDFFSKHVGCDTVMMLMTPSLKVALLTDHMPLSIVVQSLTAETLSRCLAIIRTDFINVLNIKQPRILVCGLNPHAGEHGYLGVEEQAIITPVLDALRREGHTIIGPIGADVAFTAQYRQQADVILAMYHDQGLPVIKYSGFHDAINVTLGLPFVRTSVDHGTALDIAGTGRANTNSLRQAILFAYATQKSDA
jgi:4-hydroxythreonine-4-phosphate dehydrogenase